MKKLSLAVAVAATFAAGAASAYQVAEAGPGLLVPYATYNDSEFTAVGLINHSTTDVAVFWSFQTAKSEHLTDGCFEMTAKDLEGFVWNAVNGGANTKDVLGYLVFGVGSGANGKCVESDVINAAGLISGNALQVYNGTDVAYIPTFPVAVADLTAGQGMATLIGYEDFNTLASGAQGGSSVALRYFLADNSSTKMVVWQPNNTGSNWVVNAYDEKQNRKSVTMPIPYEVNVIDPTTNVTGMPSSFVDGFFEFALPTGTACTPAPSSATRGNCYDGVVAFSLIDAPAYGAVQTLLGTTFLGTTP